MRSTPTRASPSRRMIQRCDQGGGSRRNGADRPPCRTTAAAISDRRRDEGRAAETRSVGQAVRAALLVARSRHEPACPEATPGINGPTGQRRHQGRGRHAGRAARRAEGEQGSTRRPMCSSPPITASPPSTTRDRDVRRANCHPGFLAVDLGKAARDLSDRPKGAARSATDPANIPMCSWCPMVAPISSICSAPTPRRVPTQIVDSLTQARLCQRHLRRMTLWATFAGACR